MTTKEFVSFDGDNFINDKGEVVATVDKSTGDTILLGVEYWKTNKCEVFKKTGGHYYTEGGSRMCCEENRKEEFLKEYKQLCLKYKLEIRGCGDCGSAWLGEIQAGQRTLVFEKNIENATCIRFADKYDEKELEKGKLKEVI